MFTAIASTVTNYVDTEREFFGQHTQRALCGDRESIGRVVVGLVTQLLVCVAVFSTLYAVLSTFLWAWLAALLAGFLGLQLGRVPALGAATYGYDAAKALFTKASARFAS